MSPLLSPLLGGLITTSSSALFLILFVVWGVTWGAISLAVVSTWVRPRPVWMTLGVIGPFGPIVALVVGLVAASRSTDG